MRSQLPSIASEIGADARTLRRAARRGTIRCHRPSPRRLELSERELQYLRSHWSLLADLSSALRTEPNVRLAVLFGSAARGDDRDDSDLDLLVDLRHDSPRAADALGGRLERRLGRSVDVAHLSRTRREIPLSLVEAIDQGRVLVDRDKRWPHVVSTRAAVADAANVRLQDDRRRAAASLRELFREAA